MQNSATIVYRCVYLNGHEYCRLYFQNERWCLSGTAVFVRDNKPTLLEYDIECDSAWHTVRAKVLGRVGEDEIDLAIEVDPDKSWRLNDKDQPNVLGCVDVDLNFSPSTGCGQSSLAQISEFQVGASRTDLHSTCHKHLSLRKRGRIVFGRTESQRLRLGHQLPGHLGRRTFPSVTSYCFHLLHAGSAGVPACPVS
jgi:Putative glycolipid-binding